MGVYKIAELVINEYYDKLHDFSLNPSFYFDCKFLEDSGIAVIVYALHSYFKSLAKFNCLR